MSRPARLLGTQLRSLASGHAHSLVTRSTRAVLPGLRRYAQAATQESEPSSSTAHEEVVMSSRQSASPEYVPRWKREDRPELPHMEGERPQQLDQSGWSENPVYRRPTDERRAEYFQRLFSPLEFPPDLMQRIMTHNSHRAAVRTGHSAGLSFIGRRVISAYFLMFLHSTRKLAPSDDIEDIMARCLNTHVVGEYVGNEWGIGRELVWAPSTFAAQRGSNEVLPGLYKVQGETVQAMIGAIYCQFGGSVAHRAFHTRVLPLLMIRGGVPRYFFKDVCDVRDRMGGSNGPLLLGTEQNASKTKVEAIPN